VADLSEKIQITSPAAFHLGRAIFMLGLVILGLGLVTMYTGDVFLPALAWCALAVPLLACGAILIAVSVTKV
jgi:hypothetical protein